MSDKIVGIWLDGFYFWTQVLHLFVVVLYKKFAQSWTIVVLLVLLLEFMATVDLKFPNGRKET